MNNSLTDIAIKVLSDSCSSLLGEPKNGAMGFVRCFSANLVESLFRSERFRVEGWRLFLVGETRKGIDKTISADVAVDIREQKQGASLLFVIPDEAGAGMDGIYSAANELTEKALLDKACDIANKLLTKDKRHFASLALRSAQSLGIKNQISPFDKFCFLTSCLGSQQGIGQAISILGLWPIDSKDIPTQDDVQVSVQLVEKLLINNTSGLPPMARIDSLLLENPTDEQISKLLNFLWYSTQCTWRESVLHLENSPNLWLNKIKPRFLGARITKLEVVPWRKNDGIKLNKWSGLLLGEEDRPIFILDPLSPGKLAIRWKTQPDNLERDSVTYSISILSTSNDVLIGPRTVSHRSKEYQEYVFATDEFLELEEGGKWLCNIKISAVQESASSADDTSTTCEAKTEEFVLSYGTQAESTIESSVGEEVRSLVESTLFLKEEEVPTALQNLQEDKKGYLFIRQSGRTGRVFRPSLIKDCESSWQENQFAIGRWEIRVNADGVRTEKPKFIPIELDSLEDAEKSRVESSSRQLGTCISEQKGFLSVLLTETKATEDYLNAWGTAFEKGSPSLTHVHTLEVKSLAGNPIGLIVLPGHPLRVAWHHGYDALAIDMVRVQNVPPKTAKDGLSVLDGSFFPLFLPGIKSASEYYLFGDMLGFFSVGMVLASDPEPEASLALMAKALFEKYSESSRSRSKTMSSAIGRETSRYWELHPQFNPLRLHAIHAGDGFAVVRGMGECLQNMRPPQHIDALKEDGKTEDNRFVLDVYSSSHVRDKSDRVIGRFISDITARRRVGAAAPSEIDRWVQQSVETLAGNLIPKLSWFKSSQDLPQTDAHLSIAFDIFGSRVTGLIGTAPERPYEVYGLASNIYRSFTPGPVPSWDMTIPPDSVGERHPAGPGLTNRLIRIQKAIMTKVASTFNNDSKTWPVLQSFADSALTEKLHQLHEHSDWVISIGKHGGIEFYDSPITDSENFDAYVIDVIPERTDLHGVQLITSTSKIMLLKDLLESSLVNMGLSCSESNCTYLLRCLKAISGRLAIRLANEANCQELVGLATYFSHSKKYGIEEDLWQSFDNGFLVPLDDVSDIIEPRKNKVIDGSGLRADLLYVTLSGKSGLDFSFIEVKYRNTLIAARNPEVVDRIKDQTAASRQSWFNLFFDKSLSPSEQVIRRRSLGRVLRFYLEKARRHCLPLEALDSLNKAIDRTFASTFEYDGSNSVDFGYVFCPEYAGKGELLDEHESLRVVLFGPDTLPEPGYPVSFSNESMSSMTGVSEITSTQIPTTQEDLVSEIVSSSGKREGGTVRDELSALSELNQAIHPKLKPQSEISILLGNNPHDGKQIYWTPSSRGNPHLMVVGKSGMGKSVCVRRICTQLRANEVSPIVFDFHGDLEEGLRKHIPDLVVVDASSGLGFNPLKLVQSSNHAWLDNIGMVRDIFAAIFPEFGDIQTNLIREALRESYTELGYGGPGADLSQLSIPAFDRFFEILSQAPKPNQGVIGRLRELYDYGLFSESSSVGSILDLRVPVVINLYSVQNEAIQKARASLILFNIYQNMFLRGPQDTLTHAIVFDEAHRASRLKLIPAMAKECRKYGLSLIVSSQEAKDFHSSVFANIAHFLILSVNESDAKTLAKHLARSEDMRSIADRMKNLQKYRALFFTQGEKVRNVELLAEESNSRC